jgi:hypothetical protein
LEDDAWSSEGVIRAAASRIREAICRSKQRQIAAKGRSLAIVQELLKKHANLKHTKMDSTGTSTAGRRGLALCSDNMEGALGILRSTGRDTNANPTTASARGDSASAATIAVTSSLGVEAAQTWGYHFEQYGAIPLHAGVDERVCPRCEGACTLQSCACPTERRK